MWWSSSGKAPTARSPDPCKNVGKYNSCHWIITRTQTPGLWVNTINECHARLLIFNAPGWCGAVLVLPPHTSRPRQAVPEQKEGWCCCVNFLPPGPRLWYFLPLPVGGRLPRGPYRQRHLLVHCTHILDLSWFNLWLFYLTKLKDLYAFCRNFKYEYYHHHYMHNYIWWLIPSTILIYNC